MLVRNFTILSLVAVSVITLYACKREGNTTHLTVRLTDSPYDASEVNVDIREVKVNMRDDDGGWTSLNTYQGVYNLLDLQNGIDTVLAQGLVPAGSVKEIRFVLGSDNSITIDNINYPLTIPSGSESGLKIKVNKQPTNSLESLLIDFDAGLSIIQTGTGDYKLKPVLRVK